MNNISRKNSISYTERFTPTTSWIKANANRPILDYRFRDKFKSEDKYISLTARCEKLSEIYF